MTLLRGVRSYLGDQLTEWLLASQETLGSGVS